MGRKRRDSNFSVGNISSSATLGTLGDNIAFTDEIGEAAVGSGYRVISVDVGFALRDLTPGEGPLDFGLCHGDYSATEVLEALSSTVGWQKTDKIEMERSRRLVRLIGHFAGELAHEVWNDGRLKRVRLNWDFGITKTLNMFVVNRSAAALTTGAVVETVGKAYLRHK